MANDQLEAVIDEYWDRLDEIGESQAKALMEFGANALVVDGARAKAVDDKANWTVSSSSTLLALGIAGLAWMLRDETPHSTLAIVAVVAILGCFVVALILAVIAMWVHGDWSMPGPSSIVNATLTMEEPATVLRKRMAFLGMSHPLLN